MQLVGLQVVANCEFHTLAGELRHSSFVRAGPYCTFSASQPPCGDCDLDKLGTIIFPRNSFPLCYLIFQSSSY